MHLILTKEVLHLLSYISVRNGLNYTSNLPKVQDPAQKNRKKRRWYGILLCKSHAWRQRSDMDQASLRVIARIHSDFPEKFGIPRQSGLVGALRSTVVFEPAFRDPASCRGLEAFSHIWLLWGFSRARHAQWSPSVRPPVLGGNRRIGVFATRSPFRPNAIGLSSVRLEAIEMHPALGCILHVSGADLMDGSPIYDIKPYLPFTDSHPEASAGFTEAAETRALRVDMPAQWQALVPPDKRQALLGVLAQDPRPSYQDDPDRLYGMAFAGLEVKFTVRDGTLTVRRIEPMEDAPKARPET